MREVIPVWNYIQPRYPDAKREMANQSSNALPKTLGSLKNISH